MSPSDDLARPVEIPAPAAGRSLLVDDIGVLVTNDPARGSWTAPLSDAAVVVVDGRVAWVGRSADAPACDARWGAHGRTVLPGWVDSHAHLVFAGDRSAEFAARMTDQPYSAGGIRTTVAATRAASDETLRTRAAALLTEMRRQGTTTVEIKSGYGLDVETERRSLAIARELTTETTFLGAHVVPAEHAADPDGYVDLVTGPMLDACAPLARWIDVFCEVGAFDLDQSRRVLEAGSAHGLGLRVHGHQLSRTGAVGLAVELGAASVDHCTELDAEDVALLAGAAPVAAGGAPTEAGAAGRGTVATLLPVVELSTRRPMPDARALLDAGATVALASDCNPGSCYSSSMPLAVALAVIQMRMTPEEAVWAATAGGAAALRRDDVGRVAVGARADLQVLDAPDPVHVAYRPGVPLVTAVLGGDHPEPSR
ncbi:amidohydrolase family protein [Actinotalea sp. M2MS4P-6]|uniref:amidohydrolase family protein n=1 Tax=Actinotalea sp. M2MS4P-6 TaxID=2983762 RepID=UPI0021E42769|nr:amidohydrolase family protein [Actinotalea sp. M2MS4P-6]MCV2394362.1 amidohydrolase family protein [Actinotalea sp. M2MS4P-6]